MNPNLEKGATYRWKPGQSGNPGGRPKRRPITERYADLVEAPLPKKDRVRLGLPQGATHGDAIALQLVETALAGRVDAVREIREALEGKTGRREEDPEDKEIVVRLIKAGSEDDACKEPVPNAGAPVSSNGDGLKASEIRDQLKSA